VIGEIFITRALIVITIIFIITSQNVEKLVGHWNQKIKSKDKDEVKKAKKEKNITIIYLFILSIFLSFVCINVTHLYFYKTPISELATFKKSTMLDSIARKFYKMIETGRIIREVD
jgi:hypothetical protein